jgi:hypothetical protein
MGRPKQAAQRQTEKTKIGFGKPNEDVRLSARFNPQRFERVNLLTARQPVVNHAARSCAHYQNLTRLLKRIATP